MASAGREGFNPACPRWGNFVPNERFVGRILLNFSLALVLALFAIATHWLVLRHWLPATVAHIGLILFVVNLAFLLLDFFSSELKIIPNAAIWHLEKEENIPTLYSTVLFSSVALVTLMIAVFAKPLTLLQRGIWLVLSLTYFLLSADEMIQIHDHRDQITYIYLLLGGGLALGMGRMLLTEKGPRKRYLFLFLVGLGMSAVGGLILDKVVFQIPSICSLLCPLLRHYLEETFEIYGNSLLIVAALGYAWSSIPHRQSPTVLRFALAVAFFWPGLPVSGKIMAVIIPVVDLQTSAQTISVKVAEEAIQAVGFKADSDERITDGEITLYLYHRTEPALYSEFGFSYALLDQNTQEVIAKTNHWSQRKGPLFTLQRTLRQREILTLPNDAPHNRALWLTLSFWYQDDDGTFHNYTIAESDQPLLSERQVIMSELVIPAAVDPASGASIAHFENGIELRQVEIPVETHLGELFQATFSWHAAHDTTEDLSQFLQFYHEESSTYWNYDQPPLGMRLPTRLWYAGLTDQETWQFLLPPGLQPGHYQIFTGLYRNRDTERLTVSDDDGNPFQDALIPLGTIQILPTQEDYDD